MLFVLPTSFQTGDEDDQAEKTVARVLNNFADTTTVAGVSFIKNSKTWYYRTIWSIFFLAALAMLLWQMVSIFQRYYKFEVDTKVELKTAVLDFPSVTLCNLNVFRSSQIDRDTDLQNFVSGVSTAFQSSDVSIYACESGSSQTHFIFETHVQKYPLILVNHSAAYCILFV